MPGPEYRYYFQERNSCPGSGGLSFLNSTTWCLQEAGRSDAQAMLNIGQDNIRDTLKDWSNDYPLRKSWPVFRDYLDYLFPTIF
jgi:hypothetical protein